MIKKKLFGWWQGFKKNSGGVKKNYLGLMLVAGTCYDAVAAAAAAAALKMYENAWTCIETYDSVWKSKEMYENVWACMQMLENVSKCVKLYEHVLEMHEHV